MPENPPPNPAWKNQGTGPAKKDTSSTPAWKKDAGAGGGKPASGTPTGGGPRAWQGQAPTSAGSDKPRSKGVKLAAALGILGLLVGAVVIVAMWLRPLKPACLVLLGTSYDVNLSIPHNIYGWEGLKDLAAQTQVRLAYPGGEPVEVQGDKSWTKLWGEVPKSFREQTVLVHLALHGGADGGGAYLFLDDPRGQEKVRLKTVLDDLPKKWPDKNVILVLEPAQVAAHWQSGMLRNHFVRELKSLAKEIENQPKLLVLCASDEDQVCWPSEEWRRTIFTHYLVEGLQGAADRAENGGDGNLRVTAGELYKYVTAKVSAWAQSNRGTRQTPILLGGEDRAQRIELVQIQQPYAEKSPDDAPGRKVFSPSADLLAGWTSCAALRQQVPGPAVYTPHLWRLYRDALVRWEQLERAGSSSTRVAVLKNRCSALETEIQRKARVDLASQEIRALPLPAVLGLGGGRIAGELAKDLWARQDKEQRLKVLQDALKKANIGEDVRSEQGRLFYSQLCRQLLAFLKDSRTIATEDLGPGTPGGESKARAVVRFLEDTFKLPRPAEMHYLVMLLEDLDPSAPPLVQDLQKALGVRLLAEEAALAAPGSASSHPYGEIVYAWIKPQVEDADKDRRLGEDWLFGAGPKEWQSAGQLLDKSADTFRKALADAAVIREALDLRDRLLADLPYYAQWLARRRLPRDAEQRNALQELIGQVERLSKGVGELSWCLNQTALQGKAFHQDQAKSDRNPDGLAPRKLLANWVAKVKSDYLAPNEGLLDRYRKTCESLNKEIHQPVLWHDMEAALAVPLIEDPSVRMSLLENSRGISRKLHEDREKFSQEDSEPREAAAAEIAQKRLALASLILAWQDNHPLAALADLAPDKLADKIGDYWKKLPDKIAADYSASCQGTDLKEAAEQLRDAEFLSRLLPGGAVPSWNDAPFGPAPALRRLRLHDLLLWQAQRGKDDYWYTESREPYYVPAAKAYARMAQDLAEAGTNEVINTARRKKAEAFTENVKNVALTVQSPTSPHWTSELSFPLTWKIDVEPGVPAGVPMYWLQMEGPLAAAQPRQFFQRQAASSWVPKEATYPLNKNSREENAEPQAKTKATLVCLYRGQRIDNTVIPQPWKADTIVNHFPPDKAGLAFRLDQDFNYGAIGIVLDCSPSMIDPPNNIAGLTRFEHAIRALDVMLKAIPDNTYVSLLIFIDRDGKGTSYEFLREPELWQEAQRKSLIADVRRLRPLYGFSPIAKAIVKSRDQGFPGRDRYKGPKLIVALTDGDDNYSFGTAVDPNNRPAQAAHNIEVGKYLGRSFQDSDTELHIVCFNRKDDPESKRAELQFKRAVEDMDPPGTFRVQPDPGELAADLELAIRPKLRLQKGLELVAGFKREGKPVSPFAAGGLQWRELDPGLYTAWVQKRKAQDIRLNAGDYMILTLKREGGDLFFERSLFASEESGKLIKDDAKGPFVVSVLQNQINKKENSVRQLIAVEETPSGVKGERLLQQQPPGFFWLEIKPRDSTAPGLVSWRRDYGYPAPALSVQIQDWPLQAGKEVPAETNLWWASNSYPENSTFSLSLERNVAKNLKDNFAAPNPVRVGAALIRIEDVAVEDHDVGTASGKRSVKSCLVVRVSHEPNKPVFVQLQPRETVQLREEHRYYAGAQKYTALFWDLPNPELARFTLHVIALDDFKTASAAAGRSVSFALPAPTVKKGPTPVAVTGS